MSFTKVAEAKPTGSSASRMYPDIVISSTTIGSRATLDYISGTRTDHSDSCEAPNSSSSSRCKR
jgi:hypothetical protein